MKHFKKCLVAILVLVMITTLPACSGNTAGSASSAAKTSLSQIDMSKWLYNSDDDVYYQIGISYCENPADESYEQHYKKVDRKQRQLEQQWII